MTLVAEGNIWVFIILTCIIGGGAAFLAGRALALGWRPVWQLAFYMALLAAGVHFFHYALFGETLASLHYYAVDFVVLLSGALLGYRLTRTTQMVTQYRWLYRRTSPLTWTER